VPDFALFLISTVAPIALIPVVNYYTLKSYWDIHCGYIALVLSLTMTGSITNLVKVTVGRPRPDIIDRCQPVPGSSDHPVYGLSNSTICTQTDSAIMNDGWRSFPSGHSSLSFAGLGILSFYLAGKLHLFDKRGYQVKAWASLTPLVGAALVAITRTMDYRHHWEDVLVGSTLGFSIAFFAYRQYFPSFASIHSDEPYPPRTTGLRGPIFGSDEYLDGLNYGEDGNQPRPVTRSYDDEEAAVELSDPAP